MTIFDAASFPSRLTKIDQLTRGDHTYLEASDECLFFGEYSARMGFSHSVTNNIIDNFKKPVRLKGTSAWKYKIKAIDDVARAFSASIASAFNKITLIPVPPSKLASDPEYDDRMVSMLNSLKAPNGIIPDIRELVLQTKPMPASHNSANRLPPHQWESAYAIDQKLIAPAPSWLGIVDDVLVTGCRFRAMSNVLRRQFPEARITGLFIARRVP